MVSNTLGLFGPDLLQFLLNLANHHAQLTCGFNMETAVNISDEQAMDCCKYHETVYASSHVSTKESLLANLAPPLT